MRNAAETLRQQQVNIATLLEHAVQYPNDRSMRQVKKQCERLLSKIQGYVNGTGHAMGPDNVREQLRELTETVNEHRAVVAAAMAARQTDSESEDEGGAAYEASPPRYQPVELQDHSTVFTPGFDYGAFLR